MKDDLIVLLSQYISHCQSCTHQAVQNKIGDSIHVKHSTLVLVSCPRPEDPDTLGALSASQALRQYVRLAEVWKQVDVWQYVEEDFAKALFRNVSVAGVATVEPAI